MDTLEITIGDKLISKVSGMRFEVTDIQEVIDFSENPVLIHKPSLDESDFQAVNRALRSTLISGNGPKCMEF